MGTHQVPAGRGRRRSSDIDTKALAAARELLVEQGWDATTMVAIAERAGVGKPALYRRWPSRAHLVFEAVFGWSTPTPALEDATDTGDWIRQSCSYTAELFERPDVAAAMPGLLAQMRTDPELGRALWARFGESGADLLAGVMVSADPGLAGQAAHDRADAAMLMIIGANLLAHQLLRPERARAVIGCLPALLAP